ncbi:MAG: hypothetical protein HYU28_08165 [Actinobacteria bacterium]|nr:hypothetical protein [Actinomycetota bacterium]
MLRKLLALGAGVAVALAGVAISPASATHSLDNVVASVNGGVSINLGACTDQHGHPGNAAQFTDVVIDGTFIAGDNGLAGFRGAVDVATVNVCVVDDVAVGPLPIIAHGNLGAAGFQSPNPGDNPLNPLGSDVCLYGTLLAGGEFNNNGAVTSRAIINATYTVNQPVSGGCPTDPLLRGGQIAASASSVALEADVAVIPAGQVTGGELDDQVSAQVHTVHTS